MDEKNISKKNHINIMFIASLIYSLATVGICLSYQPALPEVNKMQPTEIVDFIASNQFAELPVEKQKEYTRKLRSSRPRGNPGAAFQTMSEEKREAVFRNMRKVMQQEMRARVKKFFQMSKEEQDKFIDQMVAEMKNRRPPPEAGSNRNGSNRGGRPPRGNPQAMFENTDSTTRAQMHEMHERIRERMEQSRNK